MLQKNQVECGGQKPVLMEKAIWLADVAADCKEDARPLLGSCVLFAVWTSLKIYLCTGVVKRNFRLE